MFIILLLLFGGILLGFITRKNKVTRIIGDKVSFTVILLLFVFGITMGSDDKLMSELGRLGLTAVVISTACVLGSVLCALLIDRLHDKKDERAKR